MRRHMGNENEGGSEHFGARVCAGGKISIDGALDNQKELFPLFSKKVEASCAQERDGKA